MPKVYDVLGYDPIFDATTAAGTQPNTIVITGVQYPQDHPQYRSANVAEHYDGTTVPVFEPIGIPITIEVQESAIQGIADHT